MPVITAQSSSFEQVLQGAPEVLSGISRLLIRAESLLSEKNTENISVMIANLATLSAGAGQQIATPSTRSSPTRRRLC